MEAFVDGDLAIPPMDGGQFPQQQQQKRFIVTVMGIGKNMFKTKIYQMICRERDVGEGEGNRFVPPGFLHRIFHRRTKEEEILLFEKRYLKKYLRHYKLYLDHMTLPEMRLAKRCLEESISSNGSSPEPSPRCPSTPASRANPKRSSKHVSFQQNGPVALSTESSDDSQEEISTRHSPLDEELDFGPFLLGGDNGPTYVSFEQPEP